MEAVTREFFAALRKIKNPDMLTNAFFLPSVIANMIENGSVQILYGDGTILLLLRDQQLFRLYYYVQDAGALAQVANLIPAGMRQDVVCDVIAKETAITALYKLMVRSGFIFYAKFQRMACIGRPGLIKADMMDVDVATMCEADRIQSLLEEYFDQWSAHFPNQEEICEAIRKKEILVVREQSNIMAVAYFATENARQTCLKYYLVCREARGKGYGRMMLLKKMQQDVPGKKFYLWVDVMNSAGIRSHSRNGFIPDGVYDLIFKIRGAES